MTYLRLRVATTKRGLMKSFLDITASHEGRDTTVHTVEQIAREVFIPLTVGGGIRALSDIRTMLNAGADKVSINTAAIHNPDLVREAAARFGSQCIVVAIDVKRVSAEGEPPRYELFTHGGRKPTGIEAVEWAVKMAAYGAGEILLTSMDRDGTRDGFELTMRERLRMQWISPLSPRVAWGHCNTSQTVSRWAVRTRYWQRVSFTSVSTL